MTRLLRSFLVLSACVFTMNAFGQAVTLTGTIVDQLSGFPLSAAEVAMKGGKSLALTDNSGHFALEEEATGATLTLIITFGQQIIEQSFDMAEFEDGVLGQITVITQEGGANDQIFTTVLSQEDDQSSGENISGLLSASRDVFQSSAAFVFGPARFRVRGYDSENTTVNLNGVSINDLEVGRVFWSNWGGLNDVTRNQETHLGLTHTPFAFGGLGGATQIDLRASRQRPQKRFTYSLTNRNYRNRVMGTWSTGLMSNGWAVSLSASHRWAEEGYIDGTFYDGYGYFLSVDRKLNDQHMLNLVVLGSPTKSGRQGPAVQEMFDISGTNYYNPYWGYQNGEKRNARVADRHQPIVNLRHDWTINTNTVLTTSLLFQSGKNGSSALDWYAANDPRPDYYRRLPSFIEDPVLSQQVYDALANNESLRQIQWDKLYEANRLSNETINNVDGIEGNTLTGRWSRYIIEERRYDNQRAVASTSLQHIVNDNLAIYGGAHYSQQKVENFKVLKDLLGGEFYMDWDRFAERDFPNDDSAIQNDLNRPNRPVYEGDRLGHDYEEHVRDYGLWGQVVLNLQKFDLHLGLEGSQNEMWRTGNVRNGRFPDNSLGDSEVQSFFNYGVKGGATYKLDGRNYFYVNGMYKTRAPFLRNALVSPRTRDQFVGDLRQEKMYGGEATYQINAPYFKARLTGYYTQFEDQTLSRSFYHDEERSFVNLSLTGIDKEHIGMEAAVEATVLPGFKVHGVAAIGQYIFNSRPTATISQDNNAELLNEDVTIYAQNFYVAGTPQSAYTFGLSYQSKKYWSAYLNLNYFDDVWIDFNPVRRTESAVELVEADTPLWHSILDQEKTKGAFTVNASIFKSWLIDWFEDNVFFNLSFNVSNALDNQDFITGGFEQLRFDFEGKDVDRFPSRYYYFPGLNYYVNASIRF